jgi:hypothetical protein
VVPLTAIPSAATFHVEELAPQSHFEDFVIEDRAKGA